MKDDDPVSSSRWFLKRSLISVIAILALASRLVCAQQSVSVGVAVEFVERIAVQAATLTSGGLATGAAVDGSIDAHTQVIDIDATPGRAFSIYASIPVNKRDAGPIGIVCEYRNQRNESCGETALTGVTALGAALVVSASDDVAGQAALPELEVTIAHH